MPRPPVLPALPPTLVLAIAFALAGTAFAAPAIRPPASAMASSADSAVVLETAEGRIVIRLAERQAPRTCANFRRLVAQGFYDSTYFHRVIAGFMIQGGDPFTRDHDPFNDGEGGPGWTVPAEIGLPHVRGAVAMARMPDAVNPSRASNGSQFFICLADRPDLDRGGYTVFGQVVDGMETADRLVAVGALPGIARLAAGPNPERRALVKRARLEPLSRWVKPAPAKR